MAVIGNAADAMMDKMNETEANITEAAKRRCWPPSALAWQGPAGRSSMPSAPSYKTARPVGLLPPAAGVPLPAPVSAEFRIDVQTLKSERSLDCKI